MARRRRAAPTLLVFVALGLTIGIVVRASGERDVSGGLWAATTLVALIPLSVRVFRDLTKRDPGVDLIALLAMAGSLMLSQYLAGAIIALMLSGGQELERFAGSRAKRDLTTLLEKAPRFAHLSIEGSLKTVDPSEVKPGDMLMVKQGETIPVDGTIAADRAILDEATLTGEARPVEHLTGERIRSGAVNVGGPFYMIAITTSEESTYAGIVRLVDEAQRSKAPFVRLADRYALIFLPVTLVVTAIAWVISGDPVRALAVLVVATPCPLILAAPVAIVSGISRTAKSGLIVKNGAALEGLGRATVMLFDKTGTLTGGDPQVAEVESFGELAPQEIVRLAASLDQLSGHVFAAPVVDRARSDGLQLSSPSSVSEEPGSGIKGMVDGRRVGVGKAEWIEPGCSARREVKRAKRRSILESTSTVFVAVDDRVEGVLTMEDTIRADTPRTIRRLRALGVKSIVMVTGDHPDIADAIGAAIGVDEVLAERTPAEKVDAVRLAGAEAVTIMVGDGINDAPALAAANVGIAIGARGATASSETADAVLIGHKLGPLADGIAISQHSRKIAIQSVIGGMALSVTAMLFAAGGSITPAAGAILQEFIDVIVILNALRSLRGASKREALIPTSQEGVRFRADHRDLSRELESIKAIAGRIDPARPAVLHEQLRLINEFVTERLLPHEDFEEKTLYPLMAPIIGGPDPTAALSRAHLEIRHLARMLRSSTATLSDPPTPEEMIEIRRFLYGLYAVVKLHIAEEEETFGDVIFEGSTDAPERAPLPIGPHQSM